MTIDARCNPERSPSHPGEIIEDMLEGIDTSKTAIARMLGISRQQLHAMIAGRKPVSQDMAARLGKLFGNGPAFWLRLQASYDAWHAEREIDVSKVPTLGVA